MTTSDWITPRQAANTLGVSVQRVYKLVEKGLLRSRRIAAAPNGKNGRPLAIHVLRSDCQDRKNAQQEAE